MTSAEDMPLTSSSLTPVTRPSWTCQPPMHSRHTGFPTASMFAQGHLAMWTAQNSQGGCPIGIGGAAAHTERASPGTSSAAYPTCLLRIRFLLRHGVPPSRRSLYPHQGDLRASSCYLNGGFTQVSLRRNQ